MGDKEKNDIGGLNTFCDVFDNYKLTDVRLPNLKQDITAATVDYMSSFDELTRKQKLISIDDILKITEKSNLHTISDNICTQQRNPAYTYKNNIDMEDNIDILEYKSNIDNVAIDTNRLIYDIETNNLKTMPAWEKPITEPTFHVTSDKIVKLFYKNK